MAFSQEIADKVCERIAQGEPLRQICRDDEMPAWRTVYDWLDAEPEFAARIARAREIGKFARWDAERRLPHLFGAKSETAVGVTITIARSVAQTPAIEHAQDVQADGSG